MKKINFLIAFAISSIGFSQTILNQSETASRTVQDPQTVIMLPGFHANSTTVNPFIAKIGNNGEDSETVDSGAGATNPSGTIGANSFHDTQGSIDVNGGGQLQFTLPIALPPGVKSVAPQINLMYTSGSGNGIAGYGWNISGITSISRMGRTIEKDGEVGGIKLDYSDYYSFNGQRLILKSGEYGKNGAEYVTEKYSNVKIKSLGTVAGQAWQGPEYWEVTFEDGSQAWYGATTTGASNARTPIEYNIVKWKDGQGNYITYTYTQENNVAVINDIQWGGNETLSKPHFNKIVFNYSDRDLKEMSFLKGLEFLQKKLLNNIVVNSNGEQFKKYLVQYKKANYNSESSIQIDYDCVSSIQEFNSKNEPANPVTFTTNSPNSSYSTQSIGYYDSVIASGDYDGDGNLDYIIKQPAQDSKPEGYYIYYNALSPYAKTYLGSKTIFDEYNFYTVNIKPLNNITLSKQGLLLIKNTFSSNPTTTGDIELNYYLIDRADINNPLKLQYTKTILAQQYEYADSLYNVPYYYNDYSEETKQSRILYPQEIDIDSDGISELVFSVVDSKCYYVTPIDRGDYGSYEQPYWDYVNLGYRYFVIDNSDLVSNSFHEIPFSSSLDNILSKSRIMDFENDGKLDILFAKATNTNVNVNYYTKNALSDTPYLKSATAPINNLFQYELAKNGNNYEIRLKNTYQIKGFTDNILYADLNGDKNIEVLAPVSKNDGALYDGWSIYLNKGNGLEEFIQGLTDFDKTSSPYATYQNNSIIDFIDLDNDGKTELVNFYAGYDSQEGFSNILLFRHYEFQYNPSNTQFKWTYKHQSLISNLKGGDQVQPVFGSFRLGSRTSNIMLLSKSLTDPTQRKVITWNNYSLDYDININSITQGKLTTKIEYKNLVSDTNYFYSSVKKESFPYMEVDYPSMFVVSKLSQSIPTTDGSYDKNIEQNFLYRGLTTHLQGRGMIGFRQTARSSWYATGFENTKVWSGVEIDPLNEGIPIKEWSIKTNDINQVFPSDISTNNNSLLSVKLNTVNTTILVNGVKVILPVSTTSKDFQKDITSVNTIEYGSYYLPSKTISNVNNGFAISTTELKYIHNINGVGKDYYVGRPESKTELMQVYGDSKGAKEEYTYENNLLKTSKTYNRDNTGWLQDTYLYDGFGNVTEKKTSNSVDSKTKTVRTTYEDKGRFIIKKTDVDFNLETNITYNNWGQVLTQTDPLGVTLTNEYDNWGKLLKSKTNLGGTTTYTYEKNSNGVAIINQYSPDGAQKTTYTNKIGQNYKISVKGFENNTFVSKQTQYDALGRKVKESEPYIDGIDTPKWNTIEYDDYSRPIKATSYTGKIVETSYNGRTATITEKNTKQSYTNLQASGINDKFKTQVADATGNIISTTDIGGTIEFKYNAAGENTEAKYGTNVVTNKYDSWGRKIEFNDPSNGLYKYEYNDGFGALTKEISPKGYKEYTFNNLGQLITQKEVSNDSVSTNKLINVVYNAKGAIIKKHGTANGKPYSSYVNYDAYGRVLSSGEESNGKYFMQKGITYDDKSRITSYEKSLLSSNILTKTTIENVYDTWSGTLSQVKDKTSDKLLWQLEQANAKGQVLKAKLGGTSIENTYDSNNFLSNVLHKNTTTNTTVLQLGYSFNAVRNELNSRTRGGDFTIIETFAYDDNNRLVNWTNPVTGTLSNNLYDAQGRIRENDQVGVIKYTDPTKIYQATGMTLNAVGTNNYNNNLIQSIAYNENNDPVYINGEKGDVRFTYGLTDMRQMATYGGNFDPDSEGKFTKYYSEDGSYEIIKNNQTGQEKHILYIGGTPYDANIVYLKDFSEAQAKYVFMHKDYLGSILAISEESGNAIEQRHFDAWGNFTHLKVGNNTTIVGVDAVKTYLQTHNLVIDRGYTSHEHFNEVGIIHMNGRLYDPMLRRFLNADENIQDPHNTQNYNKYGYVMNNPLMYNDPSGEFLQFILLAAFWKAVLIGAFVGVASAVITAGLTGQQISAGGILKSAFIGALSGAVTFGIGQIFVNGTGVAAELTQFAKSLGEARLFVQGGMHAVSQGVLSVVQGGDFWSGALSGFMGHMGGELWGSTMNAFGLSKFAQSTMGMVAFGTLSGGIGAELAGGNFWQGAVTGGVVAGLNSAMHKIAGPGNTKKAENLAKEYKRNSERIIAESVVMELLLESTEVGDFTLKALREELLEIYGDNDTKEYSRVYSQALDVYKEFNNQLGDRGLSDIAKFKAFVGMSTDIINLSARNKIIEYQVKYLSKDVYYKYIRPDLKPLPKSGFGQGGSFSGGGAKNLGTYGW